RAIQDSSGEARVDYDPSGLPARSVRGNEEVLLTWDAQNRLRAITLSTGERQSFDYDMAGNLARIASPAGLITYEVNDLSSRATRVLPNGIRSVWELTPGQEVGSLRHFARDGAELAEFRYEWRPDGRIAKAYERIGGRELQRSYKYEEFGRPSRVVDSNGASASYEYDAFGSRSSAVDFSGHRMETAHDWTGRLV